MSSLNVLDSYGFNSEANFNFREVDYLSLRRDIRNEFVNFFLEQEFVLEPPSPLLSSGDDTVVFVGSSTNIFKKFIFENTLPSKSGVILYQDKIRTQNYHSFYNSDNIEFTGKFSGGGLLSNYSNYEYITCLIVSFLVSKIGINPSRIGVNISSLDQNQLDIWVNVSDRTGIILFLNEKQESYYSWYFGNERLAGIGSMLMIQDVNGNFNEFSSLESIIVDGQPKFVEWGFGEEVFAIRLFSNLHPLFATSVTGTTLDLDESHLHLKFADALYTLIGILKENVWLSGQSPKSSKTILKRYLQGILYFIRELDISVSDLKEILLYINDMEFKIPIEKINQLLEYIVDKNMRQVFFENALRSSLNGDHRDFIKLSGVKKCLRSSNIVNISNLSKQYSFYGISTSFKISDLLNKLILKNGEYYYIID